MREVAPADVAHSANTSAAPIVPKTVALRVLPGILCSPRGLADLTFTLPHEVPPPLTMRSLCQRPRCTQPTDRIDVFEKEGGPPRAGGAGKIAAGGRFCRAVYLA